MKLQSLGVTLFLVAGLLGCPILSLAEEEGSMSGQGSRGDQGHHAKDGMKKQGGATEHLHEGSGSAPQAAAQESREKHDPQQEKPDEGSH